MTSWERFNRHPGVERSKDFYFYNNKKHSGLLKRACGIIDPRAAPLTCFISCVSLTEPSCIISWLPPWQKSKSTPASSLKSYKLMTSKSNRNRGGKTCWVVGGAERLYIDDQDEYFPVYYWCLEKIIDPWTLRGSRINSLWKLKTTYSMYMKFLKKFYPSST